MVGGSAVSNLSFWLTKNDYWNLAMGDPTCRFGPFNHTLFSPPMEIVTTCGTDQSLARNSQGTLGGVTISVLGHTLPDKGWTAVQHIDNGTVTGAFTLDDGSVVFSESIVVVRAIIPPSCRLCLNTSSPSLVSSLFEHIFSLPRVVSV
jgi:hypothetical protein